MMTIIEQFKNDVTFNANKILFSMTDDQVMGKREQGYYIKDIIDNGRDCLNYIFDNGHHYVLDIEEQILYICEPIPTEYFIHKYLEKIVRDFIDKWLIDESDDEAFIFCSNDEVEVGSLIRLLPYREDRIVYITNIMIPKNLKHKGLGKLLIKQIFDICQRLKYRLILLDVMDSFSKSLEKRNAKFLDFDKIEITKETNLT
ncbi:GNAT family N-acetyltransferase [Flavobacterium sp. LC2016-12]|uniref:GNAT family N-acetyltransferase n=1 Tax=Flavobacterium sp. LC2016-12 TaxID=2783794 RepID=UPI00188CBDB2|nr:GNAT family N-acetyltransferase [Flavobacterium sp. LC2016-12]MBF4466226.1 GNAT family N-acetyltransferase [Flavobacterium sp. LC2016-12]